MYCTGCGNPLNKNAQFCPSCGREAGARAGAGAAPYPGTSARTKPKRSVPAILFALLLLAFVVSRMALGVAGAGVMAVVTDYERRTHVGPGEDEGNIRGPTRYEVFYRFTGADGKTYTGSMTKSFAYGIKAASDGAPQTLAVRYLPMMPHINAPDGDVSLLPGVLLLGLAALLFALGIKGSGSIGYKKRR